MCAFCWTRFGGANTTLFLRSAMVALGMVRPWLPVFDRSTKSLITPSNALRQNEAVPGRERSTERLWVNKHTWRRMCLHYLRARTLLSGMTKRQTTAIHHKPPQTTANHHKPPQTTTHHRKPPQTTTRIWDDNTSVWPCAVKKRLNHRKPPQTTSRNFGFICIHVLVKSKLLLNYNRFSNSTINVFVQFVFRFVLRPLLELARGST